MITINLIISIMLSLLATIIDVFLIINIVKAYKQLKNFGGNAND